MFSYKTLASVSHYSFRMIEKIYDLFYSLLTGFWLGILNDKGLDAADELYYRTKKFYKSDDYNLSGLFPWENNMILNHFPGTGEILLIAAGGGRELIALTKMGFKVDAYECNEDLIQSGNELLKQNDSNDSISYLARNRLPELVKKYNGIIIGWGAFGLIRGSKKRKEFLKGLKSFLNAGAPIMLSFLTRKEISRQSRTIVAVANFFRTITFREKIEDGDYLAYNYVHMFTKEEISKEIHSAGFQVVAYDDAQYGCAIIKFNNEVKNKVE
jgi:hypothetical protein